MDKLRLRYFDVNFQLFALKINGKGQYSVIQDYFSYLHI